MKEFKHDNGFTAVLYGKRSMSIYDATGKERYHTGFRNVETEEEVMALLDYMPEFEKALAEIVKELDIDEDDRGAASGRDYKS